MAVNCGCDMFVRFYSAICVQLTRNFLIRCSAIWWIEYVVGMGERKVAYSGWVGKTEGGRPFGRLRKGWYDDIKMNV